MSGIFGGKPKGPSKAQLKAQRRQNQAIEKQTALEARETGARQKILNRNRSGSSLFAQTGAAGVGQQTLGG